MSSAERTLLQDEELLADIPLDDPATIAPDEGDIGEAPDPEVFEGAEQPLVAVAALSAAQVAEVRSAAIHAAVLGLNNRGAVHYTQAAGPRWEGINRGLIAAQGRFPNNADCSSFVTWCLWNGMRLHNLPDTVNGQGWRAGFTGTQLNHGTRVSGDRAVVPGDLALYGSGRPGKHVAICIGGGLVISHGSEAGPFKLALHYRNDLMEIRRYIGAGGAGEGPVTSIRGVKRQQQAVNGLDYTPALVVDDQWGPRTEAGVKWLQQKVGAAPDGQWGKNTEAKYVAFTRTP
jgi:cell wall-associated NlpC family hydrolase